MSDVKDGVAPSALIIAAFRAAVRASPEPQESAGNVYLAIALTTLDASSGIMNFFPRDDSGGSSGQYEVLEPGDGIICCGEDVNPNGGGDGGAILMIRYQVPSDHQERR